MKAEIIFTVPPRSIEGADEVLEGKIVEFSSGNHCLIYPMVKNTRDGHTRVVFSGTWKNDPSPVDTREFTAFVSLFVDGGPPDLMREITGTELADTLTTAFLQGGNKGGFEQ